MDKPLFIQIYEKYKKYILLGIYKQGEKLPSVREVASQMGVNPHTVNRGYLMLEEEGLIETIFKKGSFVKEVFSKDILLEKLKDDLNNYKNNGVKKEELNLIIKRVYGDLDD